MPFDSPAPVHKQYLRNADLLAEILRCKDTGIVSNKLVRMLDTMCKRIAAKPNFRGYSWREDMEQEALVQMCTRNSRSEIPTILRFNEEKSRNPFAYVSTIIRNVFLRRIKAENKQRDIRDEILMASGFLPSYGRQTQHALDQAAALAGDA